MSSESPVKSVEPKELMPRAAFDMYSDEDDDDCELVEIPEPKKEQSKSQSTPVKQHETLDKQNVSQICVPSGSNQTSFPQFNSQYPVIQHPITTYKQTTYISTQQIDGPTMLDFQEVNKPAIATRQDLSLYAMRQNESNRFYYNDLPSFRQCINFRGRGRNPYY